MSTELKLRPPHHIAEYEMVECNGRKATYNQHSIPGDKLFFNDNVKLFTLIGRLATL